MSQTPITSPAKETRELIKALAAVSLRHLHHMEDGNKSTFEKLSHIADFDLVTAGFTGIAKIPDELKSLDDTGRQLIRSDITEVLIAAGISHRDTDAVDIVLEWILFTAESVRRFINRPLAAIAV